MLVNLIQKFWFFTKPILLNITEDILYGLGNGIGKQTFFYLEHKILVPQALNTVASNINIVHPLFFP